MGDDKTIPTELTAIADRLIRERLDVIAQARKLLKAPPPERANPHDSEQIERETWVEWRTDIPLVTLGIHWRSDADAKIERVEYGRCVSMERAKEADQKRFLQEMLRFKWLSPTLRRVVMKELGLSLREHEKSNSYAVAVSLRVALQECKARMRQEGKRPHGGVHDACLEQVANSQGITVEALKKRLERYPDDEMRHHSKKRRPR